MGVVRRRFSSFRILLSDHKLSDWTLNEAPDSKQSA